MRSIPFINTKFIAHLAVLCDQFIRFPLDFGTRKYENYEFLVQKWEVQKPKKYTIEEIKWFDQFLMNLNWMMKNEDIKRWIIEYTGWLKYTESDTN